MNRLFENKPLLRPAIALGLALVLYMAGLKLLLVPVLLVCLAWYLPFPQLFRSFFARLVVSFLLLFGFVLIAGTVQFFIFPGSGFRVVAVLTAAISLAAIIWLTRYKTDEPAVWIEKKDLAGVAAVLFFLLPAVLVTEVWKPHVHGIAQFGGTQSTDAANHIVILEEVSRSERLQYDGTSFYPKGFHFSTAFMQDSLLASQADLHFGAKARIYVMHYLIVGSALIFILFYLCHLVSSWLAGRDKSGRYIVLAVTLGLPVSFLYVLPFMYEGFLNYIYVIASFACALIYLAACFAKDDQRVDPSRRWLLLGYFVLVFGVSMSWPLLVPPLLLVPLLYMLPKRLTWHDLPGIARRVATTRNVPILLGFALQLMPIYLQLRYAVMGTEDQLLAYGAIREFHFGILLAGLVLTTYLVLSDRIPQNLRSLVHNVFVPFYLLLAALVAMQYFAAGEMRYYAIKSALFVEVLLLVVAVAWFVNMIARSKLGQVQRAFLPVLLLTFAGMLLIGVSGGNPLKQVRELFREQSGFGRPAFFEPDMEKLVNLGSGGMLYSDNVAVAHYDAQKDKLFSNMMTASWAMVMQKEPRPNFEARKCAGELYTIAIYREESPQQQADLVSKISECAALAREREREYFVVTDEVSAPHLRALFGSNVTVISK